MGSRADVHNALLLERKAQSKKDRVNPDFFRALQLHGTWLPVWLITTILGFFFY